MEAYGKEKRKDKKEMTALYELADQYKFLDSLLEDEADAESFATALSSLRDEFGNKVSNIGKFVLSLSSDIGAIRTEESRLAQRRKTLEGKIDWLKEYLHKEMTFAGIDKVQQDVVTVSLRLAPPSCIVVDLDEIPSEYRRVIPEHWEPDKVAIIYRFKKTGEIVPGVEIVADKKTVQVR